MYILYMYTCHSWNYLGDWITPHGSEESGSKEADLFNNNYMLYCTRLLAQISTVLGNHTAAAAYSAAAQAHADSIHRRWFVPATGGYLDSKQTHLVLPLVSGAVPAEEVERVRANLAQQILSTQVRIVCLCTCNSNNNNNKFQNLFNKNKLTSLRLRSMDGLSFFEIFSKYVSM